MMANLRPTLHLALALALVSLTCGLGAACASMEESCCCMMADGSSPCTEVSGGSDGPAAPEPASTIESGKRFSVAVVDASPAALSPGTPALPAGGRAAAAAAATVPLYLSHCALLC